MLKRLLGGVVVICFLFSGCSQELFNFEDAMRPPKLSDEQMEIYEALTRVEGSNIKLRYPKTGDNRSAFMLEDIDGDGQHEAIVFFDKSDAGNVRISLLKKSNDMWKSICTLSGLSADIEKVAFTRFGPDGLKNLIVGYDMADGVTKTMVAYRQNKDRPSPGGPGGEALSVSISENYSFFEVVTLDNNNTQGLLLFSAAEKSSEKLSEQPARARIYSIQNNSFVKQDPVVLNNSAKNFYNVVPERRSTDQMLFYVDMSSGTGLFTEVLAYERGRLRSLSSASAENAGKTDFSMQTYRAYTVFSKDVDNDGIVDIPLVKDFPGQEDEKPEDRKTYIQWSDFSGENDEITLRNIRYEVSNTEHNYTFVMPANWIGEVWLKEDSTDDTWTFIKYTGDLAFDDQAILSIAVLSSAQNNTEKSQSLRDQGYFSAGRKGNGTQSYYLWVNEEIESGLSITKKDALERLYVSELGVIS